MTSSRGAGRRQQWRRREEEAPPPRGIRAWLRSAFRFATDSNDFRGSEPGPGSGWGRDRGRDGIAVRIGIGIWESGSGAQYLSPAGIRSSVAGRSGDCPSVPCVPFGLRSPRRTFWG
ncbi:hypothetical protein DUI87_31439 [Hirundo rustica rustica]|uniref:Uncharacterized protein n=1 Tax=Hirundo rustica rustica TaxID=333673 RepID=A0A3M0IR97_HIRRU|nr:hypothetical protein DUI87_31439 [Hirundo rustica rustica]